MPIFQSYQFFHFVSCGKRGSLRGDDHGSDLKLFRIFVKTWSAWFAFLTFSILSMPFNSACNSSINFSERAFRFLSFRISRTTVFSWFFFVSFNLKNSYSYMVEFSFEQRAVRFGCKIPKIYNMPHAFRDQFPTTDVVQKHHSGIGYLEIWKLGNLKPSNHVK